MQEHCGDARSVSAALFNNAAFTEVLACAHILLAADGTVTTRQVAAATGRSDSVVRPVLLRLATAGLLIDQGSTAVRGPRPFARGRPDLWKEMLGVVSVVSGAPIDLLDVGSTS